MAVWRWFRPLRAALPEEEEEPLYLTLDETAVRFHNGQHTGWQLRRSDYVRRGRQPPRRACTPSSKGKAVTLVAIICSDSAVQPSLPQWLLANSHLSRTYLSGCVGCDSTLLLNFDDFDEPCRGMSELIIRGGLYRKREPLKNNQIWIL